MNCLKRLLGHTSNNDTAIDTTTAIDTISKLKQQKTYYPPQIPFNILQIICDYDTELPFHVNYRKKILKDIEELNNQCYGCGGFTVNPYICDFSGVISCEECLNSW